MDWTVQNFAPLLSNHFFSTFLDHSISYIAELVYNKYLLLR